MIEIGLFSKFFGALRVRYITYWGSQAGSVPYRGEAYEQVIVRAIIDCIATHAAKAEAMHVVMDDAGRVKEIRRDSPIVQLLNSKPNPLMSGFDFKYKLFAQLEDKNTSLAYVDWAGTTPRALIPIQYTSYEFFPVEGGGYAVQFTDYDGMEHTLFVQDVVVLRKFYNKHDVSGDSNAPIYSTLDMLKAGDEGLAEALQVANKVRGLIKQKKGMLSPEDVQRSQDAFAKRYAEAAQKGGIVGIDAMEDYTPLSATNIFAANAAQMKEITGRLYAYWRVSYEILTSNYTETQWKAFYEGVIEPLLIMAGQAFTNVCLTPREYAEGHRIIFNASVLMNASTQTKVNLITATKEIGLFTPNEYREMLGYAPVVGGDERLVSLNYAEASNLSKYQTGEEEDGEEYREPDAPGE